MTGLAAACAIALAVVPVSWRPALQERPADVGAIVAQLKSADPTTRAKAACELRELGNRAAPAIDALAAMLSDASPVDPQICGQRWRGDDTSTGGEFAAAALVAIGSRTYPVFERALHHDAWVARRNAAWGLGVLDDPRAVSPLIATLKDSEAPVRRQAAWALGVIDRAEAVEPLLITLKDQDPRVRQQTAWALGVIDDNRAGKPLIDALGDADAQVREMSAWALGVLDEDAAVAPLMSALKDDHAGVRQRAAWALGVIGNPRAVEPLLGALKDRDPEVRRQAAWAIGVLAK
jgi:HEAT repeat protein